MAIHVTHSARAHAGAPGARQQLRSVARRGKALCCSRRWVVSAMQKTHSSFMHSFIAIFSARQLHTTAHMPCFCVHSPKSRISGAHACRRRRAASQMSPAVAAQTALACPHLCRFLFSLLVRLVTPAVLHHALRDMRGDGLPACPWRTPARSTPLASGGNRSERQRARSPAGGAWARTVAFLLRCWRCSISGSGRHAPRRCDTAAHRGHAAGCPGSP